MHNKALLFLAVAQVLLAQETAPLPADVQLERDVAYAEPKNPRQLLDVYRPMAAKNLPVVVWIHGGGWRAGNKTEIGRKPLAFTQKGFVFVAVNYRFVPTVPMDALPRDIAKAVRWVHDHIGQRGGDPERIFLIGHSAGAQLAALVCTDDRFLKEEGLSLAIFKGCVPVDGDTYDVPLQVATAEARYKSLGQPTHYPALREKLRMDPMYSGAPNRSNRSAHTSMPEITDDEPVVLIP